jgi:hypothetical protein
VLVSGLLPAGPRWDGSLLCTVHGVHCRHSACLKRVGYFSQDGCTRLEGIIHTHAHIAALFTHGEQVGSAITASSRVHTALSGVSASLSRYLISQVIAKGSLSRSRYRACLHHDTLSSFASGDTDDRSCDFCIHLSSLRYLVFDAGPPAIICATY